MLSAGGALPFFPFALGTAHLGTDYIDWIRNRDYTGYGHARYGAPRVRVYARWRFYGLWTFSSFLSTLNTTVSGLIWTQ